MFEYPQVFLTLHTFFYMYSSKHFARLFIGLSCLVSVVTSSLCYNMPLSCVFTANPVKPHRTYQLASNQKSKAKFFLEFAQAVKHISLL